MKIKALALMLILSLLLGACKSSSELSPLTKDKVTHEQEEDKPVSVEYIEVEYTYNGNERYPVCCDGNTSVKVEVSYPNEWNKFATEYGEPIMTYVRFTKINYVAEDGGENLSNAVNTGTHSSRWIFKPSRTAGDLNGSDGLGTLVVAIVVPGYPAMYTYHSVPHGDYSGK